jgi:hypothetical protein
MKVLNTRQLQLGLFLLLGALATPAAQAQNSNDFETSGEARVRDSRSGGAGRLMISRPGVYTLRRDIVVRSGDAITITASGVTLNLNGHSVTTEATATGRGIFVDGGVGVTVRNGKVSGFNTNVAVAEAVNVIVQGVQIIGKGVAPSGGPSEVGILLLNTRGATVRDNTITSVNLGIFVRGGGSTGNRIFKNVIVGGGTPAHNLLGICYNPAPGGDANSPGPRGDNVYNNHIARFGYAIAISPGSGWNIFNQNTLASFNGGFRELEALTTGGGTNLGADNREVIIPATVLPAP